MHLTHSRGQATAELLIILTVLLVVLSISVSIFANNRTIALEQQTRYESLRAAQKIADGLQQAMVSPAGTKITLFVPPSSTHQTIYVRSGAVEVLAGQVLSFIPIPNKRWSQGPFYDGNTITILRDTNGITIGVVG